MFYAPNLSETNVVETNVYTRRTNQKLMLYASNQSETDVVLRASLYASNQSETDVVRVEPIRN